MVSNQPNDAMSILNEIINNSTNNSQNNQPACISIGSSEIDKFDAFNNLENLTYHTPLLSESELMDHSDKSEQNLFDNDISESHEICTKNEDDIENILITLAKEQENYKAGSSVTFQKTNENWNNTKCKFPYTLWNIINKCETDAIKWSSDGHSIVINRELFEEQYLGNENNFFKTKKIISFIRQLNIYGFKKVANNTKMYLPNKSRFKSDENEKYHEFKSKFFIYGRYDLLQFFYRRNSADIASEKSRKKMAESREKPKLNKTRQSTTKKSISIANFNYSQIRYVTIKPKIVNRNVGVTQTNKYVLQNITNVTKINHFNSN